MNTDGLGCKPVTDSLATRNLRIAAHDIERSLEIVPIAASAMDEWDSYVDGHPQATLYHRWVWRDVIQKVFGHTAIFLVARDAAGLAGVLPLVRLRSWVFGDYLVSMPYFNFGGALARSPEVCQQLMLAAGAEARRIGCGHVEFRDTESRDGAMVRMDKVCMELALPGQFDVLWSTLGAKIRAQVRKPQKEGAQVVHGGEDLLPEFYAVFARNMRDLGTPVYPLAFFREILRSLPAQASIAIIRYKGKAVAAGFLLGFRNRLEIPWASSLREYNPLGVNMMLYAEVIRFAIESGYRVFDFGRSSVDSGTYRFKKQWGASARQLYWHYWLAKGRNMPQLNPGNPKYRLAVAAWRRLPLRIATGLGPHIVKYLP